MQPKKKTKPSLYARLDNLSGALLALEQGELPDAREMEVAKEALSCYRDLGLAVREGAKKLAKKIAGLRFGNEAFKEALLIDCDRFALAQTPEMQEKIFDRIVSALKSSKSPDAPPPVQSPDAINIGGHTEDAPERFRSVTL